MSDYQEKRKAEYPEIGEQLDMLWHFFNSTGLMQQEELSSNEDETNYTLNRWFDEIKTIKEKYPKPE